MDFTGAELKGARLQNTYLEGSNFSDANLQTATLDDARLAGAMFDNARLHGATLERAQLQGASFWASQLQGASLASANAGSALFFLANLEGASLYGVHFEASALVQTRLQGASFDQAVLVGADLTGSKYWRSQGRGVTTQDLRIEADDGSWGPFVGFPIGAEPWNQTTYQALRTEIEALPAGALREAALARIKLLDCSDTTLPSCDPQAAQQGDPIFADWRKQLTGAKAKDGAAFQRTFAAHLQDVVCSQSEDAIYVVRSAAFSSFLSAAGDQAATLGKMLLESDPRCPVAKSLGPADLDRLFPLRALLQPPTLTPPPASPIGPRP